MSATKQVSGSAWWPRWQSWGLAEALLLFALMRIGLSLFVFLLARLIPLPAPCTWQDGPLLHTEGLDYQLIGVWLRWDACWYEKIATLGYRRGDPSVNFFPLFPLLQRITGTILGDNFTLGGLITAGLTFVAALTGLYRLVADDFDQELARRTLLLLTLFPGALFFFMPYTEGLFLTVSVWALWGARRGHWGLAGLCALLAGLTRTQGIVLVLPLAWELWRQWAICRRRPLTLLVPALAPLSLYTFVGISRATTGWSTLETQRLVWGNHFSLPWETLLTSTRYIVDQGSAIEFLNVSLLLLGVIALAVEGWRLPFSYTLLAGQQLVLILLHQSFRYPLSSTLRYLVVIFPLFVIYAHWTRRRRLQTSWVILSLLLLFLALTASLRGTFV